MSSQSEKRHFLWPLWLQLLLTMLTALLLVNLITAWTIDKTENQYLSRQIERQTKDCFSILAAMTLNATIAEDIAQLKNIVEKSMRDSPDILEITILNEQDNLLIQKLRPGSDNAKLTHYYSNDILSEGKKYGSLAVKINVESGYAEIKSHIAKNQLFITAMLGLLAFTTVFFIYRLAIRPLHKITDYLTSLSAENKPPSLAPSGYSSQELALLAHSARELGKMIRQRKQRELELLQTREQLQVAHDEALSANHAKSGFLATMSHEIRTPINAILGILSLLKDNQLTSQQRQLVQIGCNSGESLLNIVNDILDFSKMEADKLQLEHSSFNLRELFSEVIGLMTPQAEHKGLELKLKGCSSLPAYANGDANRIQQVLINLINNAIKFTSTGKIIVDASAEEKAGGRLVLQCRVKDTGIGIPQEFQKSLFDKFSMADNSYSRPYGGTGLGLAICKRLVSLMQGDITVISEPEKGSTFTFSIELTADENTPLDEAPLLTKPPKNSAPLTRILLAEDNPANQMVIKSILEYASYKVDLVPNGRRAVEAVSKYPYDLVLMDISMPEMDGITATQKIRQLNGKSGHVPVVALTAHAFPEDRQRFLAAGMNDYLAKPIDRASALECIVRWTGG